MLRNGLSLTLKALSESCILQNWKMLRLASDCGGQAHGIGERGNNGNFLLSVSSIISVLLKCSVSVVPGCSLGQSQHCTEAAHLTGSHSPVLCRGFFTWRRTLTGTSSSVSAVSAVSSSSSSVCSLPGVNAS